MRTCALSDVYFAREPEILVSARDRLLGPSESRKWYKVDVLEKIMVRAMRECKWSRWKACRALSSVLRIPCVCLPPLEKKSSVFSAGVYTAEGRCRVAYLSSVMRVLCLHRIIIITMNREQGEEKWEKEDGQMDAVARPDARWIERMDSGLAN